MRGFRGYGERIHDIPSLNVIESFVPVASPTEESRKQDGKSSALALKRVSVLIGFERFCLQDPPDLHKRCATTRPVGCRLALLRFSTTAPNIRNREQKVRANHPNAAHQDRQPLASASRLQLRKDCNHPCSWNCSFLRLSPGLEAGIHRSRPCSGKQLLGFHLNELQAINTGLRPCISLANSFMGPHCDSNTGDPVHPASSAVIHTLFDVHRILWENNLPGL